MPDPDLLPGGRQMPVAAPPRLDAILAGARRRRRLQVATASAVTSGVAVALVLVFFPGSSTSSLKVVTPAVGTSPTPAPSVTASTAHVPGSAGGAPLVHRSGVATAGPGPSAGAAGSTPAPGESSAPASSSAGHGGVVGPPHRMVGYDATKGCNGSGPTPATGWCSYYEGATGGAPGQVVTLAAAICRLPGQAAATLISSDGRQADFAVGKKAYPPVWTWSRGQQFSAGPTSIAVSPGQCVEWSVSWAVVDDAGRPLAPGTYYLNARPYVEPAGDASADAYNDVTFTVS